MDTGNAKNIWHKVWTKINRYVFKKILKIGKSLPVYTWTACLHVYRLSDLHKVMNWALGDLTWTWTWYHGKLTIVWSNHGNNWRYNLYIHRYHIDCKASAMSVTDHSSWVLSIGQNQNYKDPYFIIIYLRWFFIACGEMLACFVKFATCNQGTQFYLKCWQFRFYD